MALIVELTWESGSTTLDIGSDGEDFTCKIDFEFALDEGVRFRMTTSSCGIIEYIMPRIWKEFKMGRREGLLQSKNSIFF